MHLAAQKPRVWLLISKFGPRWFAKAAGSSGLNGGFFFLFMFVLLCMGANVWAEGGGRQGRREEAGSQPVSLAMSSTSVLDVTNGLGFWIWTKETYDNQSCQFWKAFEIPRSSPVTSARLRMTVDNGYDLFLDGRRIGRGSDWRSLTEYDLTWVLTPGVHVLAVEAFNDKDQAGLILGLHVELADGQVLEIGSDHNWWIVPNKESDWYTRTRPRLDWTPATVKGALGASPWWKHPVKISSRPAVLPLNLHFWETGWFQISLLVVCGIAVLACMRLAAQLALQTKSQQLLQLERARIARDIHDDLGARLTQLVLQGEVAQSELPVNSEMRLQIDQMCQRARDLSHAMDEIVWAVNSRRDTLRDFATHMCKYAQAFLNTTSIRCRLDVEVDLPPLPFDLPIRRNLFLAVKEALNNAAKHSEATELFLTIKRQGQGVVVVVADNGKGIGLEQASLERNGLTNMNERMSQVGGTCRISGEPDKGCRVEFTIPVIQCWREARWFGLLRRSKSLNKEPDRPVLDGLHGRPKLAKPEA